MTESRIPLRCFTCTFNRSQKTNVLLLKAHLSRQHAAALPTRGGSLTEGFDNRCRHRHGDCISGVVQFAECLDAAARYI